MINEWLSKRKWTSGKFDKMLTHAINEFREDHTFSPLVINRLYELAEKVVDGMKDRISFIDTDDAIQECVLIAWEKLPRFDPEKGKAMNFFTTIMMGQLRQLYRAPQRYKHLKDQYIQFKTGYGTVLRFSEDQITYMKIGGKDEEQLA